MSLTTTAIPQTPQSQDLLLTVQGEDLTVAFSDATKMKITYEVADDGTLAIELPVNLLDVKRVLIHDTDTNYGAVFYDDGNPLHNKWIILKALYYYASVATDDEMKYVNNEIDLLKSKIDNAMTV